MLIWQLQLAGSVNAHDLCMLVQPGSDMEKAEKLWAKKQKRLAAKRARLRHQQQLRLKRQQRQAARRRTSAPQQVCYDSRWGMAFLTR